MQVLLIEPYYGGSHRAWTDGYRQHSRHDLTLLTLPAQFWKWRMQGGAVTLARLYRERGLAPDVILASDMFDLSTFLALTRPQTAHLPIALYFHENQLTYPQNRRQRHGWQYGFINYASALAADRVLFNSAHHRHDFFDELPRMLKHFGDYNELDSVAALREKAEILPLGLDLRRYDVHRPSNDSATEAPLILWNHRWEDDKNPRTFLNALYKLHDNGLSFRVALAGENFRRDPAEFEMARERLGARVVHYGYVADFAAYARLLWAADYVVSTAYHDFFGIAVTEAMYCQTVPILPNRLNYPALVPASQHAACLYGDQTPYRLLKLHLTGALQADTGVLRVGAARFDWATQVEAYDALLADMVP